jgi:DNA-binding transcriptional ArsR family regulator
MVTISPVLRIVAPAPGDTDDDARLDQVFAALSDPTRRRILERLDVKALLCWMPRSG